MSDDYRDACEFCGGEYGHSTRCAHANRTIGWQGSGPDFELYGSGPYEWTAFDEDVLIGTGKARTRLGAQIAMWRFQRTFRTAEAL